MIILSLVIGLLPGICWLMFYLREDGTREPVLAVIRTFLAGAGAAFVALGIQLLIEGSVTGDDVGVAVSGHTYLFAGIEEVVKLVAAYVAVRYTAAFDEPVDAIVYPAIAALGFASVENVAVAHVLVAGGSLAGAFEAVTLRFIGATLIHSVSSGTAGYLWGRTLMVARRGWGFILGLVAATALHGTFNVLILTFGNTTYTFLFLAGAVLLVLFDFHELRRTERKLGFTPPSTPRRA